MGQCANVAPQTPRDEKRNMEGATGIGKRKRRRGGAKGERQQTQQTQQTELGREDTERREGEREQTITPHTTTSAAVRRGADNQTTATTEGEGKEGDKTAYNPTLEYLRLQEVYRD